ncbi:hypothetical protein JPH1_49230 [Mycobacterium avium subsp. hominissuis]|uniref:Uncharacterized protein n=1 Tax=Mycobacterium avium subsp. hominissuis TaxID=439334 RepID=A0AAI8X543_MYCAV|nr:hypothetical protein JPH1_49230 [Mycobacterium avium subsp. hominissuis]
MLNTTASPPPISASYSRSTPSPVCGNAMIRMAEITLWLTNIDRWVLKLRAISTARVSESITAAPMPMGPAPNTASTTVPAPIPNATPMIISTASSARTRLVIHKHTAAAIGAKKGSRWSSTSWARYQARPAATVVCAIGHKVRRRRRARSGIVGSSRHDSVPSKRGRRLRSGRRDCHGHRGTRLGTATNAKPRRFPGRDVIEASVRIR